MEVSFFERVVQAHSRALLLDARCPKERVPVLHVCLCCGYPYKEGPLDKAASVLREVTRVQLRLPGP